MLGLVIRGERNLSHDTIRGFSRALGLTGREAVYFEKLVLFNQSKNASDKEYYLDQLLGLGQGTGLQILSRIKEHSKYLSHWYVVAIRELVASESFDPNPDWISRKLKKKISRKQAEAAIKILIELGLIKKEGRSYKVQHPTIDLDPGSIDFAIRNFHKEYLERAVDAVEGESIEERELSSLTLCVAPEDISSLRERIKKFRHELNQEFPKTKTGRSTVVAINTQMLVLTETEEEKTK